MSDDLPNAPSDKPSRRGPLLALVVVIAIVIGGIWLARTLGSTSRLQDCVMAGRSNCAPIATGK